MQILSAILFSVFICIPCYSSQPPLKAEEPDEATLFQPVPGLYNDYPTEKLQERAKELAVELNGYESLIDKTKSAEFKKLLLQKEIYENVADVLSITSQIVVVMDGVALSLCTALGAPSYVNYILSGILVACAAAQKGAEKLRSTSNDAEKKVMKRNAYAIKEYQQIMQLVKEREAAGHESVGPMLQKIYRQVMRPNAHAQQANEELMEQGLLGKGKEENIVIGYQAGATPPAPIAPLEAKGSKIKSGARLKRAVKTVPKPIAEVPVTKPQSAMIEVPVIKDQTAMVDVPVTGASEEKK